MFSRKIERRHEWKSLIRNTLPDIKGVYFFYYRNDCDIIRLKNRKGSKMSIVENIQIFLENIERIINENKPKALSYVDFALTKGNTPICISVGKDMYACSSKGNNRHEQEDATVLIKHPKNREFECLAVADGVGGSKHGEKASKIAVDMLNEEFCKLDIKNFSNKGLLKRNINAIIEKINKNIYKKYNGKAATTLVFAIVCKTNTYIVNIGDSRAYFLDIDGTVKQITEDDSLIMEDVKSGKVKKEDARFHQSSIWVLKSVGSEPFVEGRTYSIPNGYRQLMLCTDGLSDCLSTKQISNIMRSDSLRQIGEKLVFLAIDKDNISYLREGLVRNPKYGTILPGKDNVTVAVKEGNVERGER